MKILDVKDLHVHFKRREAVIKAVNGASFAVEEGRIVGISGDNGSGKTVAASAILGLLHKPGKITAGEIRFQGQDLLSLSAGELRRLRGRGIFMIFQSPTSVLNPALTVGMQIAELLVHSRRCSWEEAHAHSREFLERVGMPREKAAAYPFQLSGGMRQRTLMAMALVLEPRLLIADEPTTGLDAINQEALLDFMLGLQQSCGASILLISHDLKVIAAVAEEIYVMHQGTVIESGLTAEVLRHPRHPQVRRLVRATAELDGVRPT
jgi:oligopeptide transport system ATP-binding protein